MHDKLLVILSERSMVNWVGTEIANAREREAREKKQMLFPITINIPDFRWEKDIRRERGVEGAGS